MTNLTKLEEAACDFSEKSSADWSDEVNMNKAFVAGANWQSEQSNQAIQELVQALEEFTEAVYAGKVNNNYFLGKFELLSQKHQP